MQRPLPRRSEARCLPGLPSASARSMPPSLHRFVRLAVRATDRFSVGWWGDRPDSTLGAARQELR